LSRSPRPDLPQARWDFHCNLRPGHVLADVLPIHPLAVSYLRSAASTPGHAAALRETSAGTTTRSALYPLKLCSASAPAPCSSSAKPPTPHFPSPATSVPSSSAKVYRQLSLVQSRYLSHMHTAAAGLHTARSVLAGSVARSMPPPRFCTEGLCLAANKAAICLRRTCLRMSP
jgi:hypothetical protein